MISPWNFPVILSLGDAIPALLAGNAVVIKPSEITPLTLMEMVRGLARGGRRARRARRRQRHGRDRRRTGRRGRLHAVHRLGADRQDRDEARGRDADPGQPRARRQGPDDRHSRRRLERAVNATAWGGLLNTGQICISIERVYVEEPIYDEFVAKLTEKVETLRQGADGDTYTAEVGAMTSPAQIEIVSDQVEDARDAGARILTGGKQGRPAGDWYEPTVIADVDHSMKVMIEETFGPVIPVMKVRDVEEAIRLANDTQLRPRLVRLRGRRR